MIYNLSLFFNRFLFDYYYIVIMLIIVTLINPIITVNSSIVSHFRLNLPPLIQSS
jgi:hypothetical protein